MLGFRVWDRINKCFLEKDELYLSCDGGLIAITATFDRIHSCIASDRFIPMQSVGNIDVNGKTIYEQDIFLIDYARESGRFFVNSVESFIFQMGSMLISDAHRGWNIMKYINALPIEVIGNTMENPELLEKVK